MTHTVIPADGKVFISVQDGRPIVSRFVRTDSGYETYTVQPARNWQTVEPDARRAVAQFRAAGRDGDWYPCPAHIAFGASFSEVQA